MQVQEIMTRDVTLIDPNTTLSDAARKMRADDIGALRVGENDRLIGVVTDRDIAMRAVAEDRSPGTTSVREVMSDRVYYCFERQRAGSRRRHGRAPGSQAACAQPRQASRRRVGPRRSRARRAGCRAVRTRRRLRADWADASMSLFAGSSRWAGHHSCDWQLS